MKENIATEFCGYLGAFPQHFVLRFPLYLMVALSSPIEHFNSADIEVLTLEAGDDAHTFCPDVVPLDCCVTWLTSMMLSHSKLSRTPTISIVVPDVSERSMLSKPSVMPELVHVVTRTPSTYTSTVLSLVSPLYSAGGRVG